MSFGRSLLHFFAPAVLFTLLACGSNSTLETSQVPEASAGGAEAAAAPPPATDAAGTTETSTDALTPDDAASTTEGPEASSGPPVAEAGSAAADDAAPESGDMQEESGTSSQTYSCTLVIGILATQQWWDAGFPKLVNASKWELIWVHSGFVQLWADPNDPVWKTAITSPCAQNSTTPDRILFVALNFDYNMLSQWLPPLTATVKNLQAKYPSVKRIEVGTFVRAPGDMACPQAPAPRSTITPAEDDAIAMVAQANPNLVFVAPKFEASSCSEFTSNPPHPTAAGAKAWAEMIAQHYGLGQ